MLCDIMIYLYYITNRKAYICIALYMYFCNIDISVLYQTNWMLVFVCYTFTVKRIFIDSVRWNILSAWFRTICPNFFHLHWRSRRRLICGIMENVKIFFYHVLLLDRGKKNIFFFNINIDLECGRKERSSLFFS